MQADQHGAPSVTSAARIRARCHGPDALGGQGAGFDDMTIAQGRLMMGIDTEGTRLSVLADRAQIGKQTATALVDQLERAGYVERVPRCTH
jgi:DNA-binding MarR family transcriptional regulator